MISRRVIRKVAPTIRRYADKLRPNLYEKVAHDRTDKIKLYPKIEHTKRPLVSIVVPAYNTPEKYLLPLIHSVVSQTYDKWELVIVDASDDRNSALLIEQTSNKDSRIVVVKAKNKGISRNTNIGIGEAKGEYIAFMDHDDTLELNALDVIVEAINNNPEAGLFYSDEDKLSEDGSEYLNPHFKPDFSPHLLSYVNYITHFVVVKSSIAKKLNGLDPTKDGAQDYDFILRVYDTGTPIVHVPEVLYHWRIAERSTAQDISNKPYVLNAGVSALAAHYSRLKIDVDVMAIKNKPGFYDVIHKTSIKPTIVFMPVASTKTLEIYIDKLWSAGYLDGYIVVCPKGVRVSKGVKTHFVDAGSIEEFMTKALEVSSNYVIWLSDFVFPSSKDWAIRLAGLLEDPRVHTVSPVVLETDGTIYDSGITDTGYDTTDIFKGFKYGESSYFGNTDWPRNVDYVTGRVIALRKSELNNYLSTQTGNQKKSDILRSFSASQNDYKKYNVLWSNVVMTHAKVSISGGTTRFFNKNIYKYKASFHPLADEQEIIDALLARNG